jgi:hypothetical protein
LEKDELLVGLNHECTSASIRVCPEGDREDTPRDRAAEAGNDERSFSNSSMRPGMRA